MIRIVIFFTAFAVSTFADILITVETGSQYIKSNTGSDVTFGCSFIIDGATSDTVPYIYWYKGKTIDDADAVEIFYGRKGYQSNPDMETFYNGYEGRADIPNLDIPSLVLRNVSYADVGRYWCMVTDYTQSSQIGMDTDSTALAVDSTEDYVYTYTPAFHEVAVTSPASLDCYVYGTGTYDMITWLVGPHHEPGVHTGGVGTYEKIGSFYYYSYSCSTGVCTGESIESAYNNKAHITATGTLVLAATVEEDNARYWCRGMNMHYANSGGNIELQTDQSSTVLQILSIPTYDCTNLPDGTYPDVNSCSNFWQCVGGTAYHMECYPGLVYSEIEHLCDWPSNVCGECSTAANPQECP